ncbi:hypothetical protein [Kribbella sp. CA-294648]|uniref:hypothetical protein n=1 Tax=Kribbella sp. CA-294648 TaxID=3239948 RepID=UPI003D8F0FF3
MTTPTTGSPGDELRAYHACRAVEAYGLTAVPAYDDQGRPTGQIAIDPAELSDWLAEAHDKKEGDD